MKIKKKYAILSILLSAASTSCAVTIATGTWLQYNFTNNYNPVAKDNFNYYIAQNGSTNSTYAAGAVDSLGNTIDGITLTSTGWAGSSFVNPINPSIDGDATGAPGTSTWSNDELVNFWWDNSATATITISGLDNTKAYNIYYYSKLSSTTSSETHTLDINGSSQLTATRSARYASDSADLTFTGVTLNGSDDLAMTWNGGNPFVSAIVIETVSVPEPSSTTLLGLGGLALILRRRKS